MGNQQAPGSEKGSKTPGSQGSNTPGSQDRDKSNPGQMDQAGRQNQPGGAQGADKPHDSNPGKTQDAGEGRDGSRSK